MWMTLSNVTTKNNCLCFQACANNIAVINTDFVQHLKMQKNLRITCTAQVTSENENF